MALPTTRTDRRRTPRTNLASLAYINFEPDNGGIVLNVSEEGLCFHAVAPVQRSATLPFSLFANGNCVEAVGLIAWTDEHRKIGGLRFDHLAPDARRQIRNLVLEAVRAREGSRSACATQTRAVRTPPQPSTCGCFWCH